MIPIDHEQVRLLEERLRGIGVDRRTFLKVAAAATSGPLAASLLAACGGSSSKATSTTAAPAATATKPSAAATATTSTGGGSSSPTATTATVASPTSASASPTASEAAATGTTATLPLDADQTFFDYGLRNGDPSSHDFNADLYCNGIASIWGGLLTYDVDFNPIPEWAEKWEPNADASVWTFHLRKDNKGFSNGDPVNAQTFIYSWQRLLKPETKGAYASILFDIKGAQDINLNNADPSTLGVKALDDWTFEVTMVGPRGLFPIIAGYSACLPCHPASVDKFGAEYTDPAKVGGPVISNGPFVLTKWDHNVECDVEKNPNYWNADNIKLTKVVNKIIPQEQGFLPYESGDVDWSIVPGADLPRVQADATMGKEVQKWVEPLIWKILPGTNVDPYSNLQVRQALSHCVDRDRINDLTNKGGDPAYCLVPPGIFGYFGDEFKDIEAFDPQKAMDSLKGTPFEGGKGWPETTMISRDEAALNSQIMAEDVIAQIKDHIGLDIKLQIMDFQAFRDEQFKNQYQLCWIRWYYDYPDPNNGYFDMFYSQKDSGKRQAWSNKQFDDLTIQGKQEADPDKRLAIYKQCEQIMQNDVAYIPIVYRNAYDAYKPWVQGVPVNKQGFTLPNGNIFVNMWNTVYISGRKK